VQHYASSMTLRQGSLCRWTRISQHRLVWIRIQWTLKSVALCKSAFTACSYCTLLI